MTKVEVEALERLIVQLSAMYSEISQLARKVPNDALNKFKLKLINKLLSAGNLVLLGKYRPFDDFDNFDEDDLPTNSDVAVILTQYIKQAERYRSDNIQLHGGSWVYKIDGQPSSVKTRRPTLTGERE
jgi:hypothetical protein